MTEEDGGNLSRSLALGVVNLSKVQGPVLTPSSGSILVAFLGRCARFVPACFGA